MKSGKELLFSITRKDLEIDTFRSGGKGGQHQNKVETGVRIRHPDSGAVGEARDGKSQHLNKKAAFERLVANKKFKIWVKRRAAEEMGNLPTNEDLEPWMQEQLKPENLRIEYATHFPEEPK